MPKELDSYRLHLEELKAKFGEKGVLDIKDVMRFSGIKDYRTAKKKFNITGDITQVEFARRLSKL